MKVANVGAHVRESVVNYRVLHLIPSMEGGGSERALASLAGPLARGCDLHVALLRKGPNYDRLARSGATIHVLPSAGNYDPRLPFRIARLIRQIRPDVVQTWLPQMDVIGGVAAQLTGRPWIVSERASAEAYPPTLKNVIRVALARGAAFVLANSRAGASYWNSIRPEVSAGFIRNPVLLDEIAKAPGMRAERPLILFAGRFEAQKNILVTLEAFRRMLNQRTDVETMLCGVGPIDIVPLVAASGHASRIALPGYVTDLWSRMKRAAVFVSVSHFEGQPNTVLEAAACGTPLVLSDIPMHRELIAEGLAALLVDRNDPTAIADAIRATLDDRDASAARALRSKAFVSQCTIDAAALQHLQTYKQVATGSALEESGRI